MDIIDGLLGEHGLLYALFDTFESQRLALDDVGAKSYAQVIEHAVASHATLEDELLFPAIEQAIGPQGPLTVMRAEHRAIEKLLAEAVNHPHRDGIVKAMAEALALARLHFLKEENVLFQLARNELTLDARERLGAAWAERRQVQL